MRLSRYTLLACLLTSPVAAQDYYVYVAAESQDEVSVVHFDGTNAMVHETIQVGYQPTEIEGPHGVTVSPDGEHWYVTMAHGVPYGKLYKYTTGTNELVGETELGLFPATMQISPKTGLLYAVNFNLHGDMVPSSVSVVEPNSMTEITQIETGAMPHGSRISPDGRKHYSVAMMSDELFELDTATLEITRRMALGIPGEMSKDNDKGKDKVKEESHEGMDHSKMDHAAMGKEIAGEVIGEVDTSAPMKHGVYKPTWVIPHPDGERLFVAANGSNMLMEVDLEKWEVVNTLPTGKGPYNVEISPDGSKMVVTYKSEGTTAVWDVASKTEIARITNSRKISHGIAMSSDNKYAFVSVEGIGSEPGSVDVISLDDPELVATADVGKQAGGISFWKMEE